MQNSCLRPVCECLCLCDWCEGLKDVISHPLMSHRRVGRLMQCAFLGFLFSASAPSDGTADVVESRHSVSPSCASFEAHLPAFCPPASERMAQPLAYHIYMILMSPDLESDLNFLLTHE